MAITNRDLDSSEQVKAINVPLNLVATSLVIPLFTAPFPVTIQAVKASAIGLSGAPTGQLKVTRNSAAGATAITGGATTLTLQDAGTSGPQSFVLAAAGSSFLNLAAGDVLTYTSAGANTAAFVNLSVIVKATQDIKSYFGSSY